MFLNGLMRMNKNNLSAGIDTNILVYFLNEESIYHTKAKLLVEKLQKGEIHGMVSLQNISELYAIVTDHKRFPRPMTADQVVKTMKQFLNNGTITLVFPLSNTKKVFFELMLKTKPKAQHIHDIFLAATLLSNGINALFTENTKDFFGIKGFEAMTFEEYNK